MSAQQKLCDTCGINFEKMSKFAFNEHMLKHKEKTHQCDKCTSIHKAFTNKCHVIIEHVPQAIERTGKSLFLSSEQVVEATHQKFSVFWERFKVLELEREKHGDQLLACTIEFNACNF